MYVSTFLKIKSNNNFLFKKKKKKYKSMQLRLKINKMWRNSTFSVQAQVGHTC